MPIVIKRQCRTTRLTKVGQSPIRNNVGRQGVPAIYEPPPNVAQARDEAGPPGELVLHRGP